jgi:hypothetical protein
METYNFVAKYNFESSVCNIVSKTQLYNDVYEYHIESKIGCDNIAKIISAVKLIPLTYISSFPDNTNFEQIIQILKNFLTLKFNISINDITIETVEENLWEFTPYINSAKGLNYLYVSEDNPINDIDIYPLQNFIFCSTSIFTPAAHKKSTEPQSKLINLEGVYLLESQYTDIVDEIQKIIQEWENDGYMFIPDSSELQIFAMLWNIKRVDTNVYSSKEFDLQWINNALMTTRNGDLPQYLLTGNWMFAYSTTNINIAFISYSFIIYYAGLVIKNKSLLSYITGIRVNNDLSIYAHFGTYEEATKFKPAIEHLQGTAFKSYHSAIKAKILLDHKNKNIITLIIPIADTFWLVWNGNIDTTSTENADDIISNSTDKIIYNIISGSNVPHKKLYLNGILSTDITTGLIDDITTSNLELNGKLHIQKGILYHESQIELFKSGSQNSQILDKLQKLWERGYFLSNWGITVYIYSGLLNSYSLRIPTEFLDLHYKKDYNTLQFLIS